MIPSRREILVSLAAAWRLLTFRPDGFALLAQDAVACWRSFFAMVLAAPAFALSLERLRHDMGLEEPGLHFYGVWAMLNVILWFAFPLLLLRLSENQPFARRVPGYITAANWVSLPAAYLNTLIDLVEDAGLFPGGFADGVALGLMGWFLGVQWWLLRRLLGIPGSQAIALVILSEGISIVCFLWGITRTAMPQLGLPAG